MKDDSRGFFLKEKPVKALIAISKAEETYCSEVSKEIDSTYAHTVNIVSQMREFDLLETRKSGRKKLVKLNQEGRKQADIFVDLLKHYDEYETGNGKLGSKEAFD